MPIEDQKACDLFPSYHWRDRDVVEPLARPLCQEGLEVFLDRWYLVPGLRWQTALERVLLSCLAAAVLIGSHGLGSWQQREKGLALDRQARDESFPVIPVLLPGAEPALEFLSLNTWVDLREGIEAPDNLSVLSRAARGEPPGPALEDRTRELQAAVCPFLGLSCFREEDASFFFGRESFNEPLSDKVRCRSLVAVVGASGCGKSSVVRAGLLPRLRKSPWGRVYEMATLVSGDRPMRALAAVLLPLLEFVLKGLWEARRGGELHHEVYDAMRGGEPCRLPAAHACSLPASRQPGQPETCRRLREASVPCCPHHGLCGI